MDESGTPTVVVCYSRCEACMAGSHFDPPQDHRWAGIDDVMYARETGKSEPTGSCACPCAGRKR